MATGTIKTRIKRGFFRLPTTINTTIQITADNITEGSLPTKPANCAYTISGASSVTSNAFVFVDGSNMYIYDYATNARRTVNWVQFE